MAGIFISYRREDGRADAGRLTKELKERFGEGQIFRDIDTVEPGVDFVAAIHRAVSSCGVLLAIIGPHWLTVVDRTGKPRLQIAEDYVRLEIEAALQRDIRVIPVLVGGAPMPASGELPVALQPLARRQAHELSETRWDYDVERLALALEKVPGVQRLTKGQASAGDAEIPQAASAPSSMAGRIAKLVGAAVSSAMGVVFVLAGVIEGQGLAFVWGGLALGLAYWLVRGSARRW